MKITRSAAVVLLTVGLTVGDTTQAQASVPSEYQAALAQARDYVRLLDISKGHLYDQLHSRYGGHFAPKAAHYGADHVKANWNKEALGAAKAYRKLLHLSIEAIRTQLTSQIDQFTAKQADYAVAHLPK